MHRGTLKSTTPSGRKDEAPPPTTQSPLGHVATLGPSQHELTTELPNPIALWAAPLPSNRATKPFGM
jgi:hypothetical protein